MKLPFEILDIDQRQARVRMRAPLAQCAGPAQRYRVPLPGELTAQLRRPDTETPFPSVNDIAPIDADYIYPLFRALSQTVIEGYWIDYSRPGVLQESAPLLAGQTVYADHHYWNVEKWLGVVNDASWDADGAHSNGIPGINVEMKIDAFLNPRIARGLLMQPPAIHSASVTVLFEFEYSHPDLIEEGRFWDLLGEEVKGEVVRLIATKILGYWEISLVFQGADRSAKQLPLPAPEVPDDNASSYTIGHGNDTEPRHGAAMVRPDQCETLATANATGDLAELSAAAETGRRLLELARAECRRLATLATLGSEAGELPQALRAIIDSAGVDQLTELTEMYRDLAAQRFTPTRSSVEQVAAAAAPELSRVDDTTLL